MLVRPDTFDGYLPVIAASETDLDKFKATHDINVFAPFLLTKRPCAVAETVSREPNRQHLERIWSLTQNNDPKWNSAA
jgi:hypothetical protein